MSYFLSTSVLLVLFVVGFLAPCISEAQGTPRCFDAPGITDCVEGRFREYWEQNGGLAVFGYPIGPATTQQTAEGTFLVQYFERNRFELHPEQSRPYDVLLGRMGVDQLTQQRGRKWPGFPKGAPIRGCLWFAETSHSVCDQEAGLGFKSYWESHGLQDPALNRFQRSLALFGLPLSEPVMETNATGATVLIQWFERARFEWHPNNPREFKVLLGLLGREILPTCHGPLTGGFGRLWSTNYRVRLGLGCPLAAERAGTAAEQMFEYGLMYYWSGQDRIYVLLERPSGWWHAEPNTWREDEALEPVTPPPGLYAPERGFGKVWRAPGGITRERLGWAKAPEVGMTGVFQGFERGQMLYSPAVNGHPPRIYVLYDVRPGESPALWETYPD